MDAIVERLADIEATAEAIVQSAEDQKKEIERQIQAQRDTFDRKLSEETEQRLSVIRAQEEEKMARMLEEQAKQNRDTLDELAREFDEHHTEYAKEILRRITEV